MKRKIALNAVGVAILLATSGAVTAAGFQVTTHSATGLGRANAGEAAIADNASVLARNPAAMTRFDSPTISGGLNVISPDTTLSATSFGNDPFADQQSGLASTSYVPNIYYIHPINDRLAVGAAVFSNFGTGTEFSSDFDSAGNGFGGLLGGTTSISTVNINTSIAYKFTDALSLGFGVNAIYGSGEIKRNGQAPFPVIGYRPVDVEFEGSDWDYGWNVGALYELNENHRFGLSYRSGQSMKVSGNGVSSNPLGTVALDTLAINLPEIAEFSGFHQVADRWAVHYSVQWIGWSAFDKLDFYNGDTVAYSSEYNWDDSMRYAIGTTYTLSPVWTLRAGIAHDESPIAADNRVLSIPDSNRIWYSAGASYAFSPDLTMDLGVTYVDGESVEITEKGVTGTSESNAWIYGAQLSYTF